RRESSPLRPAPAPCRRLHVRARCARSRSRLSHRLRRARPWADACNDGSLLMTMIDTRPVPAALSNHAGIRSILVPLAGQPEDRRCLKTAAALASRTGSHVQALYVIPDPLSQLTALSQSDIPIPDSVLMHQARLNDAQRRAIESDFAAWREEAGLAAADA